MPWAIRERYLAEVRRTNTSINNDRYIADDRRCAVKFEADRPQHGPGAIVDVFTVDEHGKITALAIYRR